jgi:hypothetical protein
MVLAEQLQNKWKDVIEHPNLAKIADPHKRAITAVMLENTEAALQENGRQSSFLGETASGIPANFMGTSSSTQGAGGIDTFDPILISMVRRTMPNLMAYDICGVQPMTGPTGLIFALRSRYTSQSGAENFYNEVNTGFSTVTAGNTTLGQSAGNLGGNTSVAVSGNSAVYNFAGGMKTAQAEALGSDSNSAFGQLAFSIEKVAVEAKSRALKAEYTMELAQDLKALHGLDAEAELSNFLTTEILAEINREVVRTVNVTASTGAALTTTPGTFDLDVDANGRWSVEKFKGLMMQLELEANAIAKATRRGKGNIIICHSDVASALQMAGVLDYTPALNANNLNPDDTGNTFAGILNGRYRVYIDPYASGYYATVGYKGSSAWDAGLFYCPYVPLQMVRAVDQSSFQPKIGFKTRYGMVANPFANGATAGLGALTQNSNVYYRRFLISHIM